MKSNLVVVERRLSICGLIFKVTLMLNFLSHPAKIGVMQDPVFLLHNPGIWHPESPQRLVAVEEGIKSVVPDGFPISARPAASEELCLVHTRKYVDMILNLKVTANIQLDPDTALSPRSQEAALRAVGGVMESVDLVMAGDIKKAFCAVRPPGHHAESDRAMGFCIFNNIALGAAYALTHHHIKRLAIVDWDLHHGNGTQRAFYTSDRVLFISLHQYPYYPGSGAAEEQGEGPGLGYTVNIPMAVGSSDDEYRAAFGEIVLPALQNYEPELLMISCGFDAHYADPLGGMNLTSAFYGEMTAMLVNAANEYCKGRIISVLEGGYDFNAIRESTAAHIKELIR